jgi:hypothetical protein
MRLIMLVRKGDRLRCRARGRSRLLQEIVSATTEQTGHNTERFIMLEQSILQIR